MQNPTSHAASTPPVANANHRKGRGLEGGERCCIQVVVTTAVRRQIREAGLLFREDELNRSEVVRVALALGLDELRAAGLRGESFASLLQQVDGGGAP